MGKSVTDDQDIVEAPVAKRYALTFNQNRSFELHVGRQVIPFAPYETVEVSEAVRNHVDFKGTAVEPFFQIQEVK
jgi:hypothetical protein